MKRDPYDTGYADGWRESKPGVYRKRKMYRHRARNAEYALGYKHGQIDGRAHPDMPEWPNEWQTAYNRPEAEAKGNEHARAREV